MTSLWEDEGRLLSLTERTEVDKMVFRYEEIFDEKPSITSKDVHRITTTESAPIAVPVYRLTPAKQQLLREEIDKMLDQDVIEESDSPWAAPVVMVPKPDGGLRVCINYRQLNAITIADAYPLPRIEDLLHSAKKTPYMLTMDLRSGYWQISVDSPDRSKTAFIGGIY
jgi:hypothetical protein